MQESESDFEDNVDEVLPDEFDSFPRVGSNRTDPGPSTDAESRKTILRTERKDTIGISNVLQKFYDADIPESFTVVERTETYYGPELLLAADGRNYRLTAPGPDTQLLLWGESTNEREYRESWVRLAELQVFIDGTPQYDICDQCGAPIRSKEHERLSAIGRCPKSGD